jgi:predicted phosphodiesterase
MAAPQKSDTEKLADAEMILRQKGQRIVLLERELRQTKADQINAETVRREIHKLGEVDPEPPKWLLKDHKTHSSGVPVIPLSDWHWGEVVDPNQVGGMNIFNRSIAKQRVRMLADYIIDLCFNHMTNPIYEGAVIPILGDMITGIIHDELRETNEGPVQVSCLEVEEYLIALLLILAEKFGRLYVVCVPGNHGRNTIKPRIKNRVYESYEWNIYQHIERFFRRDPRVKVYVPNDVDAHITVAGHRIMVTHGDLLGVKGGDGIIGALGPIARGAMKVGNSEARIGNDFDTLMIGHYHIYMPRGDATPVWVNPCLVGYNEYAHKGLRVPFSRPAQSLAFVHQRRGFTAQWPIYLDPGSPQAGKNEPWCKEFTEDPWSARP